MKKSLIAFALTLALFSCRKDLINDMPAATTANDSKTSINVLADSTGSGDISELAESPLKRFLNTQLFDAPTDDNESFYDILDFPVNIVVKENQNGNTYLTSQGLNKVLLLTQKQNDAESQKFYLYRMPLTGLLYIQSNVNGQKKLVSAGAYTNNPNKTVLYVKDGTSLTGAAWTFLKGGINGDAHILQNEDVLGTDDPNNPWSVYRKVIGSENASDIYFDKYRNQGKQEFEVRPVDDFRLESIEYINDETARLTQMPDFVVNWNYSNGTSLEQSMTTAFSQKATKTSTFNRTTNISLSISTEIKVKVPFLAEGKINTTLQTSTSFAYGKSESQEDQQSYNFPIRIAPKTAVTATATVGRYNMDVKYIATMRGVRTNKMIKVRGVWSGVDCIDVKVTVTERPLTGRGPVKTVILKKIPTTPFKFD
ncbi:ETX/MTX2 family pore-forming toxin [Chitinophaga sp. Mgbs1]|uniref:ETX/MTX2 family pore-forming toxin n=1 Tax=Chitinophaga solisilvae TaxID=1233460 RepID=A0A9Q5D672_9BACT|nr:ETX/MTX2 family pore-forming toxin [Chitinophaga solisilvae]